MKTAVLTAVRKIEIMETSGPVIRNGTDVLLKVESVGVCGSDVHYFSRGKMGGQVIRFPFPLGHEVSGTVIDTGSDVTTLKKGDLAAVEPAVSCGCCDQCLSGRPHTCRRLQFLGCAGQMDGCLSEFLVMPEANCLPVGPDLSPEQAALAEPLSIGAYAVKLAGLKPDSRIAVLGSGPIGLSVLLCARAEGHKSLYATDKIPARLGFAVRAGAAGAASPLETDIISDFLTREPEGMDTVFECCGQPDALAQAVRLLKPGGKLMLVGIPETDRICFPVDEIRHKELCLQNVRRQNGCTRTVIENLKSGKINADFLITHRFSLSDTAKAFELVENYRDGVVKAMINL